ncbi:MAG: hypothetical protein M0Q91_12350 [Methanoregula sp.]|jgi:hypothetical protein|nr:hypothetical protein [Methanoregula sp.]
MTQVSETAEHWFGLCRKPPVVYTPLAGIGILPESACEGLPDGGGGGSGTIRRGIGAAFSGMRALNRNRQLLWFTLLTGLVLAGNAIGQSAFYYIRLNLHMQPDRIVWQFLIEFATLFCLVFLLAGLVLSIPSKKEGPASFFEGLAGAKKYLKAIFLWSFILALAGMLLVSIYDYSPGWSPLFLNIFGHFNSFLFGTLSHFPFNLSRLPPTDIFTEIPGYGGRSVLLWFYPGFREALIFSAINLLLLILTPFVVPLIVLGQKTLREAVAGSFAMMKKTWVEVAACAVFLGVIVSGVFLTHLLVQAAHGMVTPLATYYRPTDAWIALGLLYDLALSSVAFVVATVGGIAALDLYTSAKSRQISGSPDPEPRL